MAIKINNTTVIDDSRNVVNAPHVDLSGSSSLFGFDTAGNKIDSWNPESSQYGRLPIFGSGNFRVYTSPGTFTVSPGVSQIRVRVVGAGGNGGAGGAGACMCCNPSWSSFPQTTLVSTPGGGGGGGGYAHKVISSFPAPRTYTVTVGSAPGGTSSFGSEVSATGGSNGGTGCAAIISSFQNSPIPAFPGPGCCWVCVAGGSGGSGTGGDVNYTGASGFTSLCVGRLFGGIQGPAALTFHLESSNNLLSGSPNPCLCTIGDAGAAATQLGNGSGPRVPSVPACKFGSFHFANACPGATPTCSIFQITEGKQSNNIKRFPFDIFDGYNGNMCVTPIHPASINAIFPCFTCNILNYSNPLHYNGCDGGTAAVALVPCVSLYTQGGACSTFYCIGCSGTGAGGSRWNYVYNSSINSSSPFSCSFMRAGSGGPGGFGGGGGGGGGGSSVFGSPMNTPTLINGCPGGSGGNGLVIVEW